MSHLLDHIDDGWLSRAANWLRQRGEAFAACRELDNCAEAARLAQDFGIPLSELRAISLKGPDGAKELLQMLKALDIDPAVLNRLQPAVMRDLQHHCCTCDHKRECRDDLAAGRAGETYHDFCSNAETLDAVKKV
jgi:hypothetical protein